MLNIFKRDKVEATPPTPAPAPVVEAPVQRLEVNTTGSSRATENKVFYQFTQLRFGMWVDTPKGVGIIVDTDWTANMTVFVDLVNADGFTVVNRVPFQLGEVKQALLSQIPANRRPVKDVGFSMGYGR